MDSVKETNTTHNLCVATIGKFDVLHRGHVNILRQVYNIAKQHNIAAKIVILHPNPAVFFGKSTEGKVYGLANRKKIIEQIFDDFSNEGQHKIVPQVLVQKFNTQFASVSVENFIENYLKQKLGVKYFVSGSNFAFGKQAAGGIENIKKAKIEVVKVRCCKISSTFVKQHLQQGNVKLANKMCYNPILYEGLVLQGQKLAGQVLGYKTANILLKKGLTPPLFGVYKCLVKIEGSNFLHKAICNIGTKPTIASDGKVYIEPHIFNFNENIYGKKIKVMLLNFIRKEQKFASLQDLKNQIKLDIKKLIK